jgi:hypothetical protein
MHTVLSLKFCLYFMRHILFYTLFPFSAYYRYLHKVYIINNTLVSILVASSFVFYFYK